MWNTSSPAADDLLLQTDQRDAALLQHGDGGEQLGERTPQPIEPQDGKSVALSGIGKQSVQSGSIHRAAGADIREHLDGAGLGLGLAALVPPRVRTLGKTPEAITPVPYDPESTP